MPTSQFSVVRGAMGYRSTNWDAWDVGVAVIDSGVAASDDLRITASYDFRTGVAVQAAPYDGYGHGTHVAGLIASSGSHSKGYYQGVAPGARIISLRVLDSNGSGYTSNVIKAVEFAVANRTSLGIHVINLSLGHPIYEPAANDPLVLAVESAVRAGIVVVVSAGNNGQDDAGDDRLRAASRRPATRRRRSPSARSITRTPPGRTTTRSRRTARAARPGSTASPSPTSWRRAIASSRRSRRARSCISSSSRRASRRRGARRRR